MRLASQVSFAFIVLALTGCPEYDNYQIELKPDDTALVRTLTCWRERSQNDKKSVLAFSKSTLERIEKAYGRQPEEVGLGRFRFEGRFAGRMPQDVGGSGNYLTIESRLGWVRAYMERFRGEDDLVGKFERLAAATNRLTDLLLGWFETQMRDDESWPNVRQFIDREFRRDLHNLALYIRLAGVDGWSAGECADADKSETQAAQTLNLTAARLVQYLIDHEYLEPAEFLQWVRHIRSQFAKPSAESLQILKRLQETLIVKAKLNPADGARSLSFMLEPEKVADSFREHLRQTPEYKRLSRGTARRDPEDVIGEIMFDEIFHFRLFEGIDQLELSLVATEKPVITNGCWDAVAQVVRWQESIDAGQGMPTLCFALWSEPDEAFQEKHFGRVVLEGGALAEFAAEHSMLTNEDQAVVDELLESLRAEGAKDAVRKFVSTHEKSNPSIAEVGELLLTALEK